MMSMVFMSRVIIAKTPGQKCDVQVIGDMESAPDFPMTITEFPAPKKKYPIRVEMYWKNSSPMDEDVATVVTDIGAKFDEGKLGPNIADVNTMNVFQAVMNLSNVPGPFVETSPDPDDVKLTRLADLLGNVPSQDAARGIGAAIRFSAFAHSG